jgi:hypothetical protein
MKTRKLVFNGDEESKERFGLLFQGFLTGGNSSTQKGIIVLRQEARILDQLEDISNPTDQVLIRTLKPGLWTVSFEQPDFELLMNYIEATPWMTVVSRKVINLVDWLRATPMEE